MSRTRVPDSLSDADFSCDSGGDATRHLPSASSPMRQSPTTRSIALLFLVWLGSGELGCLSAFPTADSAPAGPTDSWAGRQSECRPRFPSQDGWYGGDAAYSVPLPLGGGRVSLWLFGDSFVERPERPGQRAYPFVHNTIGLSRCDAKGNWTLDTFWRRDRSGTPRAFFVPDAEADWVRSAKQEADPLAYYWPFGGFIVHDTLFVGLLRVVHSLPRGLFNLPFRLAGMDLARIENFRDDPMDWRIQLSTFSDNRQAFPGSAFALTASHLHAFAFFDRGDGHAPRMLSRIDLEALEDWRPDLSDALEYLAIDRRWRAGFEPDDALIVMRDDASEMSVHFDSESQTWIATYSPLERANSTPAATPVLVRSAPDLAGPWSEPEEIFTIPETNPGPLGDVDENLFCYAAKAHPQFSSQTELVITYVCNLFANQPEETPEILERLRTNTNLYRPRSVPITITVPTTVHSDRKSNSTSD